MNALHPPPLPDESVSLAAPPDAARTVRLLRRLAVFDLAGILGLLVLLRLQSPLLLDLRDSGLGGVAAAALLLSAAGVLATLPLARARAELGVPARPAAAPRWNRFGRRIAMRAQSPAAIRLGRLARRPQGIIVPALCLCAGACAYLFRQAAVDPSAAAVITGAAAIVAGFPLLVAERIVASVPVSRLPEAPGLQALRFVPAILVPLAGLFEVGLGVGVPAAAFGMAAIGVYLGVVAAELGLRALANWFLPPPAAPEARAAVTSFTALLLQPGRLAASGMGSPIRTHLGIDFSRSWALRYMRSAALPVLAVLGLVAWGLSGVSLIELDRRGIYERLGEPVAVWQPGAHVGLPWPLGRVRLVELGVVRPVLLAALSMVADQSAAEAPAPASADRLWDKAHPSEVSYLIASQETDGRQAFQTVDVDLRVLYREGLDDRSALLAAYRVTDPDALVRSETGRLVAQYFAGQTLPAVLGGGREQMAEGLRARLQTDLDALGSGIELVAVVIEAIHPPPGAAEAYHNVQAAEIVANTTISTERGAAVATAARARQTATQLVDDAQGLAADTVGGAKAAARTFTADQDAAAVGGASFLLERYFANLSMALAKSPLVIVDHRLGGSDGPVIDLRPFGAPPSTGGADD